MKKDKYTLHVYTVSDGLGYTLYVHIVGGGKWYTLHDHTAGGGKGYTLHVHTAGGRKGYTLDIHTAGGGKGHILTKINIINCLVQDNGVRGPRLKYRDSLAPYTWLSILIQTNSTSLGHLSFTQARL